MKYLSLLQPLSGNGHGPPSWVCCKQGWDCCPMLSIEQYIPCIMLMVVLVITWHLVKDYKD